MRRILIALELDGDDEAAYSDVSNQLTAEDFLPTVLCTWSVVDDWECDGCSYLKGRACLLPGGNHCLRRAEDYYRGDK